MLGSSFSIQSDESEEHIEKVLSYLKNKITEVRERNPGIEPVKTALMAALNITDELMLLKKSAPEPELAEKQSSAVIDAITKKLIEKIDSTLEEKNGVV